MLPEKEVLAILHELVTDSVRARYLNDALFHHGVYRAVDGIEHALVVHFPAEHRRGLRQALKEAVLAGASLPVKLGDVTC